jgi:uncharacterized protein YegL
MTYEAEISRANPTCFIFLIDHSTSMGDPIMGIPGNPRKADFAADAINKVIQSLVVSASKDMDVRNYYQLGIIGYGSHVESLFTGELAGQELAWIDDVYQHPLRIEERMKKESDGAGGFLEVNHKFPVWVEPVARGQTQMCKALTYADGLLRDWAEEHPESFPPTVINITDGESNDGDPRIPAAALREIATDDGGVVLLTVHLSSHQFASQIFFPDQLDQMPDHVSKKMFEMSSILTPKMRQTGEELLGIDLTEESRGIVYNADIAGLVQALEIGTRPANLAG